MTPAIQFQQVSKKFSLSTSRPRSFLEMLVNRRIRSRPEEFWALNNVTFDVQPGETVGLIGPNGTGKSTVLKLISRIIEPSAGAVRVNGRVTGLLELGSGFHPDLTGRENIYLNASILGISRRVIRRRIEEIVEFADIGPFIEAPVRTYSSGMAMRLGFAVSTALDPDILLIDEILAVGDHSFQRKCFDRLEALRADGVTILLVSHNLGQVENLCRRAIWLDDGSVRADGEVGAVINQYLEASYTARAAYRSARKSGVESAARWGTFQAEITSVRFLGANGAPGVEFESGRPFTVEIRYHAHEPIHGPVFGAAIYREDNVHVSGTNSSVDHFPIEAIDGEGVVYYHLDQLPLLEGRYQFTAAIYNYGSSLAYDHHHRTYTFTVRPGADTRRHEGLLHLNGAWRHDTGCIANSDRAGSPHRVEAVP